LPVDEATRHLRAAPVIFPRRPELLFSLDAASGALHRSVDGGRRFCRLPLEARVYAAFAAPGTTGTVYALAAGGAPAADGSTSVLLRSADAGETWSRHPLPRGTDSRVAVHPLDPDRLASVVGAGPNAASALVESRDGGRTWRTIGQPIPPGSGFWQKEYDPSHPERLYAAGACGAGHCLFRYDGAEGRWQEVFRASQRPGARALPFVVDGRGRLFIEAEPDLQAGERANALLRSEDGGVTWTPVARPEGVTLFAPFADLGGAGALLALGRGGTGREDGLFESEDGGRSWRRLFAGPLAPPWTSLSAFDGVWVTAAGAGRARVLLASATFGAIRSVDGGATWSIVGPDPGRSDWLVVAPSSAAHLYAVIGSALLRSEDGGARFSVFPLPARDLDALAVDPRDPRVLYASPRWPGRGLLRSPDGGETWTPLQRDLQARAIILPPRAPGTMWVRSGESLMVSRDEGRTFETARTIDDLEIFAVSPADPRVAYALDEDGGWFVTSDEGRTWQTHRGPAGEDLHLVLDPRDPRALLIFDDEGIAPPRRSTDGGRTFVPLALDLPGGRPVFVVEAPPPSQARFVLAAGPQGGGLYVKRDEAAGWEKLERGLPEAGIGSLRTALTLAPSAPETFFVRSGWTIYKTTTGGR
jgi:photosystem II stability/assembly factor-like uncharacterized protein